MTSLRIAHLSDLHLPLGERAPRLRDLCSKRLLSWLSWRRSRRFLHRPEVLARLMVDVAAARPDHLVVTGDLTNLSLPDEFARARDWLAGQGGGETVTVAPGNHDALVRLDPAAGPALWNDWMAGGGFPFVKRVGPAALVGVSSAVPTAPFLARGAVGASQRRALGETLSTLKAEGLFRIVLIHHPVTEGAVSWRKALADRSALRAVIAASGAELVLHGHAHLSSTETVPGPDGLVPVIGAASASADPAAHGPAAGWRVIDLAAGNDAWRLVVSTRTLERDGGFSVVEDLDLLIPRGGEVGL